MSISYGEIHIEAVSFLNETMKTGASVPVRQHLLEQDANVYAVDTI